MGTEKFSCSWWGKNLSTSRGKKGHKTQHMNEHCRNGEEINHSDQLCSNESTIRLAGTAWLMLWLGIYLNYTEAKEKLWAARGARHHFCGLFAAASPTANWPQRPHPSQLIGQEACPLCSTITCSWLAERGMAAQQQPSQPISTEGWGRGEQPISLLLLYNAHSYVGGAYLPFLQKIRRKNALATASLPHPGSFKNKAAHMHPWQDFFI